MRILGFQSKWDKLFMPAFTTFRYPRADKDWQVGELVQVVIKPRSRDREFFCYAEIARIDLIRMEDITELKARVDGFTDKEEMMLFFAMAYGKDHRWVHKRPMNRIILRHRSSASINNESRDRPVVSEQSLLVQE